MGPNEEGEITIKGPAVMIGYWNKPEETKEVLRDGWLYTGDIGLMDEEGYIKFLGRKRELIKCSGYSVFPAEVEDLLYRHPASQRDIGHRDQRSLQRGNAEGLYHLEAGICGKGDRGGDTGLVQGEHGGLQATPLRRVQEQSFPRLRQERS